MRMYKDGAIDEPKRQKRRGIAVGEPSPSGGKRTPTTPKRPLLAKTMGRGMLAGYTGPRPGTPEFKAARASGAKPIRDYVHSQIAARTPARPMAPRAPLPPPIRRPIAKQASSLFSKMAGTNMPKRKR